MSWTYDRETKSFVSDECDCIVPYPFNDNYHGAPFETKPDAYHINILYRGELKESDSYTLRKKSDDGSTKLLGWAISLLTLFTEDETIRKHEHIAEYAYILYLYLLNDCGVGQLISEHDCSFQEGVMRWCEKEYGSDTWHQNLLFCVMDKEYVGNTLNFSYYLPYFANLDLHIYRSTYKKEGALDLPDDFGSNIIIQTIAPALINDSGQLVNPYLEDYHRRVLEESSELMRFFLLYQVLEVMMDRVLLDILHLIINNIEQENGGMRDFDKQLSETNEKDRIAKVFEHAGIDYNTRSDLPFRQLFDNCNQLLSKKKHKTHTSLAYSIYNVRNLMVHRLRTLNQTTDDIRPINDALYLTINAILLNYKNTSHTP